MQFRNLKGVSLTQIVDCLSKSFEGYYVKMPTAIEFWKTRFENSRVDMSLSWGVFQEDALIGFVINAIDMDNGQWTAFNTGTGILPKHRGNQLVDKMYQYGIPELKKKGVTRCTLEVIDQNEKAISVYQRLGYHPTYKLFCYKGSLLNSGNSIIQEVALKDIEHYKVNQNYSWDNTFETIRKAGEAYQIYQVFEKGYSETVGYFIMNPLTGYVAQLESPTNNWKSLFNGISQIQKEIRINNIKEDRTQLMVYLHNIGFQNTINQIEMEMNVSDIP